MLTVALVMQAAEPGGTDRLSVWRACPAGPSADGEVVVCGRPSDQRLRPMPPLTEAKRIDPATFRLPDIGTAHLHAIESSLPGAEGQGVAVTLTAPFGKRKPR